MKCTTLAVGLAFALWSAPASAAESDIAIAHVEITQGLQNAANSIPLVQGKPTAVRVYPRVLAGAAATGITAKLHAFRRGAELPGSPIEADNGPIQVGAGEIDRGQVNSSLNFTLDPDWYAQDTELRAELVLPDGLTDPNPANNTRTLASTYVPRKGLSIRYIVVQYTNSNWTGANRPRARVKDASAMNFVRSIFPADPTLLTYDPWSPLEIAFDRGDARGNVLGDLLITELNTLFATMSNPPDRLFAWTPENAFPANGLSDPLWAGGQSKVAFGNDTGGTDFPPANSRWRRTFAHEIGHNTDTVGLKHTDRRLKDDEYGFDVMKIDPFKRTVMRKYPATSASPELDLFDFMRGGELEANAWIAPPHFLHLFAFLAPPPPSETSTLRTAVSDQNRPTNLLVVRGRVTREGGGQFFPFYLVPVTDENLKLAAATPREGSHEIRFFIGGTEVRTARIAWTPDFKMSGDTTEDNLPSRAFTWFIQPLSGITKVELLANGRVVDTMNVVDSGPFAATTTTELRSAVGSRPREVVLSWDAPSGPSITTAPTAPGPTQVHQVYYTCDDGKTWQLVASGLTQPTAAINLGSLPGGASCRFQVRTSDGHNVTTVHGQPFANATQPIELHIVAPLTGGVFEKGAGVLLVGRGFDKQLNAKVDPDQLEWISSVQGVIGTGEKLVVRSLNEGEHQITLRARGRTGETSSVTVEIKPK